MPQYATEEQPYAGKHPKAFGVKRTAVKDNRHGSLQPLRPLSLSGSDQPDTDFKSTRVKSELSNLVPRTQFLGVEHFVYAKLPRSGSEA